LPKLDAALLASGHAFPRELVVPPQRAVPLPEKVLQFGEGNFLRAFVDWMFARLNRRACEASSMHAAQIKYSDRRRIRHAQAGARPLTRARQIT